MPRTTSKPHADEAGFVATKMNMLNGQDIVLYDAEVAGFDLNDGRWVVVCHSHGTTTHESNQRRARKLMAGPAAWCSGCRHSTVPEVKRLRLMPFEMKSPEEQAREMRFAAKRVRGNPEKIALFESVYGVKPDEFYGE